MLTPKFLTEVQAATAVQNVLVIIERMKDVLSRQMCHFAVIVPSMKDDRAIDYPDYPNYPIVPQVLYEYSLGDKKKWSRDYDNIAKCKGLQLWHGRNDDRTDCMPHLLFPGDTPFWGGVKRHGIVVMCSGFQPHFDKMFSGMIADQCIALAYDAWMNSPEKKNIETWLS